MAIDDRIKELVAVGASVTANCQPCLQYHKEKALEFGADAGDIATAIEVGKSVRKGAAAKMDGFAESLKGVPPAPAGAKPPVCCG
jgi:AhpD family alkylhydroperoxidase